MPMCLVSPLCLTLFDVLLTSPPCPAFLVPPYNLPVNSCICSFKQDTPVLLGGSTTAWLDMDVHGMPLLSSTYIHLCIYILV